MLNFSVEIFLLCMTVIARFRANSMSFIARFAFLSLSLLVIFAFFEVRYDTTRRRDKGAASVNFLPTVIFQG